METTRDLKLDGLKFLLIFSVVLGHIEFIDYGLHVKRIIYSFHMPMFVFLSGYFTSLNSNREKQNKWIKKTLIIYIIAQLTQVLLRLALGYAGGVILGTSFDVKSVLNKSIFIYPEFALWYLVCLIYWRFAYWRFCKKIKDSTLFLLSLFLLIIAGFVPLGYHFSFQRTFAFFPFFILGIIFKKKELVSKIEEVPTFYALILLIIGLILSIFMPTYLPVKPFDSWGHLLLRLAQTGLGLYLCLIILRLSRIRIFGVFSKYGSKTLWVYIGHTYLVIIINQFLSYHNIQINVFIAVILAIIICTLIIFIAQLYSSIQRNRVITN